jgi:hypothetical protein
MTFVTSFVRTAVAASALLACVVAGANAETAKKEKSKDAAAKPALVGSYGDWKVYQSTGGKSRICYLLGQPKTREPEDLKRDPGYAFISERPGERVRNEVSFIVGFDVAGPGSSEPKENKEKKHERHERAQKSDKSEALESPTASIDEAEFELMPKGADLWVKNPAEESKVIDQMRKGEMLVIRAASKRGKVAKDSYSLSGFSQAIDRALKDCPGT